MTKINIFVAFLIAALTIQVCAGGSKLSFDLNRSTAYLNAGSCYVHTWAGSDSGSNNNIGYRYYNLPYGWRQYENKVYIPNLMSQKGDWTFGVKTSDKTNSANEQFRLSINGLQLRLSRVAGSGSRNLVIGSNFRSDNVDDNDWNSFLESTRRNGWFDGSSSSSSYWFPSSSSNNIRSGSGSSSSGGRRGVDNLFRNDDDDNDDDNRGRNTVIFSSTPSVVISTGSSISVNDRKTALDEQYAANRQLGDLNTLIGQLTANIDSSTSAVTRITGDLSGYRTTSSTCNDKILELSNTKMGS